MFRLDDASPPELSLLFFTYTYKHSAPPEPQVLVSVLTNPDKWSGFIEDVSSKLREDFRDLIEQVLTVRASKFVNARGSQR